MPVAFSTFALDEFTIKKTQYDGSAHAYYYFFLGDSDKEVGYLSAKETKHLPTKLAKKAEAIRVVLAKKAERAAASRAVKQASDAAKGVVRDQCQICEGSWVIDGGLTSRHGYTRPGDGWLHGSCMGAQELPYSQSCAILNRYADSLDAYLYDLTQRIAAARAGETTSMQVKRERRIENSFRRESYTATVTPASPEWQHELGIVIARLEAERVRLNDEIERVAKRIADWVAPA